MKIKGKHVLPTDITSLWPLLQDEKVLARISPGVSEIQKTGEDEYKAISNISIGPVRGKFEGALALKDKVHHESMTMVLEQKSSIGNAQATIAMNLAAEGNGDTLVHYDGEAKVSGRLATMGQRILGGVISSLTKQVFKELEKIIEERSSVGEEHVEDITTASASNQDDKNIIQSFIEKITNIWKSLFR